MPQAHGEAHAAVYFQIISGRLHALGRDFVKVLSIAEARRMALPLIEAG